MFLIFLVRDDPIITRVFIDTEEASASDNVVSKTASDSVEIEFKAHLLSSKSWKL